MTTTNFSQLGAPRSNALNKDRNGQQRGNLIFAHVSMVCKSKLGIMCISHVLLEDLFGKHEIYGLKPTNFIKNRTEWILGAR